MTATDSFNHWKPDCMVVTTRDAYEAGWNACAAFYDDKQSACAVTAEVNRPSAEDIYNAYPRKVGKQAAIKAIEKAIIRETPSFVEAALGIIPCTYASAKADAASEMLNATKTFAAAASNWPAADKQFIPHPATWFNRGSYDDDPNEWQRGVPTTQQIRSQN